MGKRISPAYSVEWEGRLFHPVSARKPRPLKKSSTSRSPETPPRLSKPRARKDGVVSLATLAEHTGLSAAVISRVLNASPRAAAIPKSTQDRIFAAAKKLNYHPNILARSLQSGYSKMVGVLLPEISEGYATLVLAGVEQALLEAGYLFILISHHHRSDLVERSFALLGERAVDGVLAIDTAFQYDGALPTVAVSARNPDASTINIALDHTLAAELAIEHLYTLGHRQIAFIKGQAFSSDTPKRWKAIEIACRKRGLKIKPDLIAQLNGTGNNLVLGHEATTKLLASGHPFSALFAFNDMSASGAIRALKQAKLRVPEDVSVVGFDDIESAAFQTPSLTTIRQPLYAMGVLAAETILRSIRKQQHVPESDLTVRPELIVRESTCMVTTSAKRSAENRRA